MRTRGEVSLFLLGGRVVSQVDKLPAGRRGAGARGVRRGLPAGPGRSDESRRSPRRPTRWLAERFGRRLDYVRVDLLQHEDEWVVSELELIEPGLYLDVLPANADPFADLVAARLTEPAGLPAVTSAGSATAPELFALSGVEC